MRYSAQRGRDFVSEILVGRHAFPWAIPVGAATFRAGLGLLVAVAARNPFVVAPLTAVAHDRDRHSCHTSAYHTEMWLTTIFVAMHIIQCI